MILVICGSLLLFGRLDFSGFFDHENHDLLLLLSCLTEMIELFLHVGQHLYRPSYFLVHLFFNPLVVQMGP